MTNDLGAVVPFRPSVRPSAASANTRRDEEPNGRPNDDAAKSAFNLGKVYIDRRGRDGGGGRGRTAADGYGERSGADVLLFGESIRISGSPHIGFGNSNVA